MQARRAVKQEPGCPLANRRHAHAVVNRCGGERRAVLKNVVNHFESTGERESGILVNVHSAELLRGLGRVAPPSLSDSVRMNRNNLLKHHT